MRKIYADYLAEFTERCGPFDIDPDQIDALFKAELFITGCRLVDSELNIHDAWSILTGYDDPVIPEYARLDIAYRLRILYPSTRSRKSLESMLNQYGSIPHSLRLYQPSESDWTYAGSRRLQKRAKYYASILEQPIDHKPFTYSFATSDEFSYTRRLPDGRSVPYAGKIPELPATLPTFPAYRTKRHFESTCLTNDEVGFRLLSLKYPTQTSFNYKDIQHVVGGLGAGKTSFMLQETIRLVKENGARIGFVESSVAQVLKRVYQFQKEGIKAVPIVGRSNRRKHLEAFLASHHHRIDHVIDWTKDDHTGLQHLSEICFIQALAEDETESGDYPCKRLKQEDKTCFCPYASQCGIYRDFAELIDADVWVATSASVLQTRLPPMLDPAERTVYEAMYDLLDIIYIDEADEVQKQFDSTFLTDIALFGDSNQLFEKVYVESIRRTVGRYGQYTGDGILQDWIDNLSRLEQTIRSGIYRKLHYSPEFARHLRGKMVRISTYAYQLSKWFGASEDQQRTIYKDLIDYSNQALGHWLEEYTDTLLSLKSPDDQADLLNRLIAKWGAGSNKSRSKYRYDWLTLYLLLVSADHCLKHFFEMYPIIQNKLGVLTESDTWLSMHREFAPFIPESMTGPLTGFHYDVKDGLKTGTFRVAQYTGVGRHLLYKWPNLYQQSDQKPGPAIVLLSGTSLAPDSAHYHVEVPVHWLLESNKNPPRILQEYYPVFDSVDKTKALAVSGQDEETRSRNLETMTSQLLSKFEWELLEWKRAGSNRKVLIIVNSYDDVENVHQALQRTSTWNNRYRKLTRNLEGDRMEDFSRAELERFREEEADILIAPMLAISRGYNILDESNSSLFGSIFFLIRPYPIPHDLTYLVQILHGKLQQYLFDIKGHKLSYSEAVTELRNKSNKLFHLLYHKPDYWTILNGDERRTIGWYTFVPVWQTIGRLLRNGTDARVFYCDAKFRARPHEEEGQSLLEVWEDMLEPHGYRKDIVSLYGPFMRNPILNLRGE